MPSTHGQFGYNSMVNMVSIMDVCYMYAYTYTGNGCEPDKARQNRLCGTKCGLWDCVLTTVLREYRYLYGRGALNGVLLPILGFNLVRVLLDYSECLVGTLSSTACCLWISGLIDVFSTHDVGLLNDGMGRPACTRIQSSWTIHVPETLLPWKFAFVN